MTDTAEYAIVGKSVTKVFKDFWGRKKVAALTDVDIEIKTGTVFGLLGPNGAGKSTLIKLMLGHLYPTSGRIAILGKDPRNVAVKEYIGYLPERSYLYKNLTATETLRFFGELVGLSRDQVVTRSKQLLEMTGLTSAKSRKVGEFSHGMTRRLGLAQALLNDPDLLILDEPTAGLDPVGCREVKDLIITLGRRGKTILLTSHLLADVEDVCAEVMLLYGGRVQSSGQIHELLQDKARTLLEFPQVSEEALERITAILAGEIDAKEICRSAPAESLESYFLNIVARSNERKVETQGAQAGLGVAEYLRAETNVDSRMLRELDPGEPEEPVAAQEIPERIDATALDDLQQQEDTQEAAPLQPEVDRQTLDDLTK